MANIKSAEKRIRTSAKKRARNKSRVSRLRGSVKKFREADAKGRAAAHPTTHARGPNSTTLRLTRVCTRNSFRRSPVRS